MPHIAGHQLPPGVAQTFNQQPPPIGLAGAQQARLGGLQGGLGILEQTLSPFIDPGQQAGQLQGAFTGLQGPEAQAQAFAGFQESPGQQFLRDRGLRAVTNTAAVRGNLGGGRVLQELQRQGIGFANQAFQQNFQNLGQIANRGANVAVPGAQLGAQFAFNTGTGLAADRSLVGQQISGQIGGTSSALANLLNQQGSGLSNIIGAGGGNLANILQQFGAGQGLSQENLAAILANIATQQGSTIAGLPGIPGIQETQGLIPRLIGAGGLQ